MVFWAVNLNIKLFTSFCFLFFGGGLLSSTHPFPNPYCYCTWVLSRFCANSPPPPPLFFYTGGALTMTRTNTSRQNTKKLHWRFQRVEATGFHLCHTVTPVFLRDPEVVHGPAQDAEWLLVEEELSLREGQPLHCLPHGVHPVCLETAAGLPCHQSVNPSVSQSILNRSVNPQSVSHSNSQSIHQSVSQFINQSINPPVTWFRVTSWLFCEWNHMQSESLSHDKNVTGFQLVLKSLIFVWVLVF